MDVIYSIGSKFAGGGIGDIAYQAVSEINKQGYLKRLITTSYKKTEIDPDLIQTIPIVEKVSNYFIKDTFYDYFASLKVEACDIFYGWNDHSLFSLRKAHNKGAKTIIDRGSLEANEQYKVLNTEFKKYGLKSPMSKWSIKRMEKEYQETDYIIVPSQFVYNSFIKQGYEPSKLILNPLGVDTEHFKPKEKEDDVFRIIFVGQVCLRKGVQYLLVAWDNLNLKNAELVLVGGIRPDIRIILSKYSYRKDIKIFGFLEDIVGAYNNSSLFVFPSVEDGFGMVVTEAMACGLPVVVSDNTGAKDVVREWTDGFILPTGDVKLLKGKIQYLYDNKNEMKRMGKNAREQAERYTWKRYQKNLVKRLESVL